MQPESCTRTRLKVWKIHTIWINIKRKPFLWVILNGISRPQLTERPSCRGHFNTSQRKHRAASSYDSVRSHKHLKRCRLYKKSQSTRQKRVPGALILHPDPGEILGHLTAPQDNSLSVLHTTAGSLHHVCKPNMALIWPTPALNPIIKTACLNISHWHVQIQLLKTH